MSPVYGKWRMEDMLAISTNIRTQDNQITANPVYVVQSRKRLYGFDAERHDFKTVWLHQDHFEADEEEAARLEAIYEGDSAEGGESEIGSYERVGYMDIWETVTVCFTQAGADRYITENRHNMTDPRVYVDTLNRNTEMVWIRSYLLSLTEES